MAEWTPDYTFELLDRDGSFVSTLANLYDRGFSRVLSATGAGTIKVDPGALAISSLAATFADGKYIRVKQNGTPVFVWRIEQPEAEDVDLDDDPEAVIGWVPAGRGWACDFDDAVVLPFYGIDQQPAADYRTFNFASPDASSAMLTAAGFAAVVVEPFGTGVREVVNAAGDNVPSPLGFPVESAEWVAADNPSYDLGKSYFRSTFDVPGDPGDVVSVTIAGSGDNFYTFYLNDQPIFGESENVQCWHEYRRVVLPLAPGTYHLSAVCENVGTPGVITNPSAIKAAVYIADSNDEPDTIIEVTDPATSNWIGSYVPAAEPSWNPGEILIAMRTSAVALDADNVVADWTLNFDATEDSNGDTWDRLGTAFSVPIGSTMLAALDQLAADGWIDYEPDWDAKVLNVWKAGGSTASGVTLVSAETSTDDEGDDINFGGAKYPPVAPIKTKMLVRYPGGLTFVEADAGVIAVYGTRVGSLTVDASNAIEAQRLGTRALNAATTTSVVADVEPTGSGDIPLDDFTTRSMVTVPGPDDTPTAYRVEVITVELDDHDEPEYVVEWQRRLRGDLATRQSNSIRTLGSVVTGTDPSSKPVSSTNNGGYVPSRTPILPSTPRRGVTTTDLDLDPGSVLGLPAGGDAGQVLAKQTGSDGDADWTTNVFDIAFGWGGTVNPQADTDAPPWRPSYDVVIHQITVEVTVTSASNIVVDLLVGGSVVETVTLTSGSAAAAEVPDVAVSAGQAVAVRIRAAAAGTGEQLAATLQCYQAGV